MNRRMRLVALVVAVAATLSSCASISVDALPQPGKTYRGGYNIVIEFENVLNLPERAKVVLDGTTVGVVTNVALKGHRVDVTSRIDPSVVVPSNVHAALQQATVLGDVYVILDRPQADHPPAARWSPAARSRSRRLRLRHNWRTPSPTWQLSCRADPSSAYRTPSSA